MRPAGGNWSVHARDLARIDPLLHAFLQDTSARCAFLLDRSGQLLTAAGEVGGVDGTAFASLAAADFAASDQLALLLGEDEFSALYHQGEKGALYLADVTGLAILAALFDDRTTLGMIRLRTRTVVPQLATVFAELAARPKTQKTVNLEHGWLGEAEDEIDRLFAE